LKRFDLTHFCFARALKTKMARPRSTVENKTNRSTDYVAIFQFSLHKKICNIPRIVPAASYLCRTTDYRHTLSPNKRRVRVSSTRNHLTSSSATSPWRPLLQPAPEGWSRRQPHSIERQFRYVARCCLSRRHIESSQRRRRCKCVRDSA